MTQGSGDHRSATLQSFGKRLKFCALLALAFATVSMNVAHATGEGNQPSTGSDAAASDNGQVVPALKTTLPAVLVTKATTPATANPASAPDSPATQQLEIPQPGSERKGDQKPAAVAEEPPVYYVRDKEGRLVPLLGYSYDEILSLIRQKKTGAPVTSATQGYSLEQLEIAGDATPDRAKLVADYKINLTSNEWVDVPLWNHGGVLEEPASYRGDAEHQLQYVSQNGAYVVRLHGTAGSQVQITLKLAVPIKLTGTQSLLDFDVPTAAASKLSLRVPQTPLELVNHTGSTTAEAKSAGRADQHSEITLRGLAGRVELAWQEHSLENTSSLLEATGQVFAQVDSRSVQFDALLTVRGFGTPFDRFRVKLPPGAQLVGGAPAGANYTLSGVRPRADDQTSAAETAPEKSDDLSNASFVDVQLSQATTEPVEIRIQAERAYDVTKSNMNLELAGFEVLEAATHRQWGHIAVAVVGDWRVAWGSRARVRQVAELPPQLQRQGIVAGFEYFGQPASLTARIVPRQTRISVEPQYFYFVDSRQLQLDARFKYNIRGAKTSNLEIAIPGWEIDAVEPANLVDANAGLNNRATSTIVPLAQPTSGEFELSIKAHRNLSPGASRVQITMPVPIADIVAPAVIALSPANNIRLRPREDELQGLVHPSIAPRLKLPVREQPPLIYRGEQVQAAFVGDLENVPQVVAAGVESDVALKSDEVQVEQRFAYHVQHEPTSSLTFAVPATLADSLEWSVDEQSVPASAQPATPADSKIVQFEVPLAEPRLGAFDVVVRYHIARSKLSGNLDGDVSGPLTIPLIMPALSVLDYNRVTINGDALASLQLLDEQWKPIDESPDFNADSEKPTLRYAAAGAVSQIVVSPRSGTEQDVGQTIVERAWIQTWISGTVRQDRAIYRIATRGDKFDLTLPPGISAGNLELKLDHRALHPVIGSDGAIKLSLPSSNDNRHELELRYQWDHVPHTRSINAQLPRLADGIWLQRMYWQLVLPTDEHLIGAATDLTPEFEWKWSGLGLGRKSIWDQADLEKWSGATPADSLPPATNRYLFSTIGSPANFSAATAARWQIVLLSSGAVLIIGLLVLYVPRAARPAMLVAVGVFTLTLMIWTPAAAMLFAQAAILGVILLLLAGILRHSLTRRRAMGHIVANGSSSVIDRSSVRRNLRPRDMVGAASTSATETLDLPAAGSQHA
jgi:hypothetical protein